MIAPEDAVATPKEMSIGEINAAIPRNVYLSADGLTPLQIMLGILVFGLICVGAISYSIIKDKRTAETLHREGHEATASITKIIHPRRSNDYVYYTFPFRDTTYHGGATVSDFQSIRVQVGDQLPILFLPSDPSVNHPSEWGWWGFGEVIAYAWSLMVVGLGVRGLVSIYLERRLGRMGWVTEGKVIACAPKGSRFRVDYVFSTDDQTEWDGANEYSYDQYKYGAKIRVIYMRNNPKRNDTYPLADFPTVGS